MVVPRLHRRGPHAGAMALLALITLGNTFVAVMMGRDSSLQVYFTFMPAGIMLLVGVENRRIWLPFVVAAAGALLATLYLFPAEGFVVRGDTVIRRSLASHAMINAMLVNGVLIFYALTVLRRAEADLKQALGRSDSLLSILMPKPIAERLKGDPERPIADRLDDVTIMFADLVGFSEAAHDQPPEDVVAWLDGLVRAWDEACEAEGIEKIKTIGDSYMAASGIGEKRGDAALRMGRFALAMIARLEVHPPLGGRRLALRVGIHRGSATAGVIGRSRMGYDLWGDAVNTASRMESTGSPGRIHVSEAFRSAAGEAFLFEDRGLVEAKGIGPIRTAFLLGPAA
ncbi:MAG: adenylate/guanylate cyclase domain-containing protein, partial [Phreatobacter sp.]|nr:adenylate/guanylate cyclase domain-containing protein [Phreatobacter sp.]